MFDLKGRAALVTGGNGGIGLGFARGLAKAGAAVMVAGRNAAKNAAAVAELKALGATADSVEVDVTDEASIRAMVATTAERLGRLDILVNNAGTNIRNRPEVYRMEDWHTVLSTNLTSGMIAAQAAHPHLKKGGVGRVINNGSMLSIFGLPFHAAYGASKGGVVQMTKSMAVAWAADGITVNVILPGWIDTPFNNPAIDYMGGTDAHGAIVNRIVPLGRQGTPAEVAPMYTFLASEESRYITAKSMMVDGGMAH